MYHFIQKYDLRNIDFIQTIKTPDEWERFKPVYVRTALKGLKFLFQPFYQEKHYPTTLRFPPEAADAKGRQVQNLNLQSNTMGKCMQASGSCPARSGSVRAASMR